ncbi:hypothetical protein BaRGS_00013709, partial [Batillaria attramentaria]
MAFTICLPTKEEIHKEVGERRPAYWCVKNWEHRLYAQLYEVYMLCIVLLLPLLVMSFAYASICRELWVMTSRRSAMATRGNRQTSGSDYQGSFSDTTKTSRSVTNGNFGTSGKGGQPPRYTYRSSPNSPSLSGGGSPYRAPTERSPVIRVVRKSKMPSEDDRTKRQEKPWVGCRVGKQDSSLSCQTNSSKKQRRVDPYGRPIHLSWLEPGTSTPPRMRTPPLPVCAATFRLEPKEIDRAFP